MKNVFVAALTLFSVYSFAQSPVSARLSSGFDVGIAYSKNNYNPSLAYYQLINVRQRKLFAFGFTVRLGAFYGDNINYYTAPARLTRGKSGLAGLSGPLVTENIDTIRYDYVTMTSANVGVRAQINLGRVELGASADLLGLTLGRGRMGRYRSSTGRYTLKDKFSRDSAVYFQGSNTFQRARPGRLNVRLLGDNDIGTLSTEVYARVRINQRFAIRAAYQWLTSETVTQNRDVVADNNRFRNRVGMAYLGLTFPIFY